MNKALFSVAIGIIILSALGIVYFISHPAVDYCAAPNPGGLGPTVCIYEESTNWMGIAISMATSVLSVALMLYALRWNKMRSKYSEKQIIAKIIVTIMAVFFSGLGLFYVIYSLALVPLDMRNYMGTVMFSCIGFSTVIAWLRLGTLSVVDAK